jgi:hypothetical protein
MLERTVEAFGPATVRYILACEEQDLDSLSITKERAEVLQYIEPIVAAALSREKSMDRQLAQMTLVRYDEKNKCTIARAARAHCGGSIISATSADPIEDVLFKLGIELYAATLLPRQPGEHGIYFPASLPTYNHPLAKQLVIEIIRDEALSKLFPGAEISDCDDLETLDIYKLPGSHLIWSNGQGGTTQIASMPEAMIQYAFDICALSHDRSEQALIAALRETVSTSRSLANGRRTAVRTAVRITNLRLADDVPFAQLGVATLQNVTSRTNYLFRGQDGTAIFDFKIDIKLLDIASWSSGDSIEELKVDEKFERAKPTFDAFQNDLRRQIDRTRFALLLASDTDSILAPGHSSTAILNPLDSGRSASINTQRPILSPFPPQELTVEKWRLAQNWVRRIQSQPGSVDMGMRRLLAAVSSRLDAMDGFVDAIICWENLFGTPEGESTFRVSGAMSILLEPSSPEKRQRLMKEIRELYRVRSRLVHGSQEPNITTAHNHRDRAVELALLTFQAVYDNDHLLHAEDSSVRSRMTLLGF